MVILWNWSLQLFSSPPHKCLLEREVSQVYPTNLVHVVELWKTCAWTANCICLPLKTGLELLGQLDL